MLRFFSYLFYIIKHKYYVGIECFKEGLFYRAFTHDLSKLRPSEFFAYANQFYPSAHMKKQVTGERLDKFKIAWRSHQRRNDHHWEYWITPTATSNVILEMPDKARREMICDWKGMSKILKTPGANIWYKNNRDKILLGPATRSWVDKTLNF